MLAFLAPTPTPGRAAAILRDIFGGLSASFAFRLWDGQEVRVGPGAPVCTAVIKSPELFLDLRRRVGRLAGLVVDHDPARAERVDVDPVDLSGELDAVEVEPPLERLRRTLRSE